MRFAWLVAILMSWLHAAGGLACGRDITLSIPQPASWMRNTQTQPAPPKPAAKPTPEPQQGATQPRQASGRSAAGAPAPWKSVEIGNYYLRRKNYRAALSRFQEAVTTDPEYAEGYLGLGRAYERTGDRRKALAAYQKYLDLLPSDRDAENAKQVHQAIARLEKRQ